MHLDLDACYLGACAVIARSNSEQQQQQKLSHLRKLVKQPKDNTQTNKLHTNTGFFYTLAKVTVEALRYVLKAQTFFNQTVYVYVSVSAPISHSNLH